MPASGGRRGIEQETDGLFGAIIDWSGQCGTREGAGGRADHIERFGARDAAEARIIASGGRRSVVPGRLPSGP
jgi:hypothetical protein